MGGAYTICPLCGYVYDSDEGDDSASVEPGTAFADLPADWTCLLCGEPKENFSLM